MGRVEIREKTGQQASELGNMPDVNTSLYLSVYILLATEITTSDPIREKGPMQF